MTASDPKVPVANPLPRLLILETSDRDAQVAIAEASTLLQVRAMTETRRHARDLAPTVAELLTAQGWRPRDIDAVVVSRGPGSYTGLRVGIMSAKTFAYVTGCRLLAIDTFLAIALQSPADIGRVDVLADAQQDKVYYQPFARQAAKWEAAGALVICPIGEWLGRRDPHAAATGPGLTKFEDRLPPEIVCLPPPLRHATPVALLSLGLERWAIGDYDDPLRLEPLYLRPSSAEEQWRARSPRP
jgi:tRNA threonylcarbamoyladenosine biosynthesis protein TsaB